MKTYVLAFDLHVPHHDSNAWAAVLDYLRHNKVDGFIFGGDQLDLGCISHWTKGKPGLRERGALISDLEQFDCEILSEVELLLPARAEKIWITGNHDDWADQLIEEMPELEGILSIDRCLELKDRGWRVIPQGGHYQLGNLTVVHGDAIGGGANPSKRAVETYCSSVAFGHYHFSQSFTKIAPAHRNDRWTAYAMPCLCNRSPKYAKGRGNSWQHGFGIVELRHNGSFNLHTCIIQDGQFSYGGRLYGRKRKKAA
jgi:hypothetical protein